MKAHLYEIKCLTNLHVGSGDENYEIVDAQVERDPVTEMPTIFSSGVKGALKEHFQTIAKQNKDTVLANIIFECFGGEKEETDPSNGKVKKVTSPGQYKFLNANFIARPLRISYGKGAYVLTCARDLLQEHLKLLSDLGIKIEGMEEELPQAIHNKMITSIPNIKIEGETVDYVDVEKKSCNIMKKLVGSENWALTDSGILKNFDLPVQARNVLNDDKISENLWYEEVVPHKSIFHFIIITPNDTNEIDEYIKMNDIIQFGGNASIGYGLCKVTKVN